MTAASSTYDPGPVPQAEYAGASWRPVDLGPYLRGEVVRPEPTLGLCRTDGIRLIYPGKEHTVIGEMESGKSWFCLACAAAELRQDRRVLYIHFEEADPADTIARLVAIDVPADSVEKLLTFVGPNEPVDPYALAALLDPAPALVILDGVNEAMALHGQSARDEGDVAAFRRRLVKPCTAVGAAVLAADHVVKDREKRDRSPLGSIHKGNGLTGSLIALENAEPFGQGERGVSHVYITKDRPGFLRRRGRPNRKIPGKTYIGTLIVDDTHRDVPWTLVEFTEPPAELDQPPIPEHGRGDDDDERALKIVCELIGAGNGAASLRTVRAKARGLMGHDRVDDALTRLTLDGRLIERVGPRRARLFTVPESDVLHLPGGAA